MTLFLLGAVALGGVCWRLCVMQDRWMIVCHTVNLSSSTKPDEVFKRLTELAAGEVVKDSQRTRYFQNRVSK